MTTITQIRPIVHVVVVATKAPVVVQQYCARNNALTNDEDTPYFMRHARGNESRKTTRPSCTPTPCRSHT